MLCVVVSSATELIFGRKCGGWSLDGETNQPCEDLGQSVLGLWQRQGAERHLLHWKDRKWTPVAVDKADPTSWKELGAVSVERLAGLTDLDCTPDSRDHQLFDVAISMSKSELKSSMAQFLMILLSPSLFLLLSFHPHSCSRLTTINYSWYFFCPQFPHSIQQSFVNFICTIIWCWSTFPLYRDLHVSHHHHYSMECKDLLIGVLVSTFAPVNNFWKVRQHGFSVTSKSHFIPDQKSFSDYYYL